MSEYIRTTALQKRQNKLFINLVDYDLKKQWHSHELVNDLRKIVVARMPTGLFDPQDLEHQVLFRLTTYDPRHITEGIIDKTIAEQMVIIEDRLRNTNADLEYLFRGLTGRHKDLNIHDRLELKNMSGKLVALGNGRSFNVEFRKITDPVTISLFTEKLHYIHSGRQKRRRVWLLFRG